MGMAQGVEIRAPFLDPEVLGVARAIGSTRILARGRAPKWLLRDGWGARLQQDTLRRRKTGFSLDIARWLRGPGNDHLRRARSGLAEQRFLAPRTVEKLFRAWEPRLESGHPASWAVPFALIQLEEQFRRWGEPA
jgi:hypothetical protein